MKRKAKHKKVRATLVRPEGYGATGYSKEEFGVLKFSPDDGDQEPFEINPDEVVTDHEAE